MDYKDYYNILGVNKNDDDKTIKKAYRKLAREFHPDVNPDNQQAEEKFKDISEAYEVLSDTEKRQKYDQFGSQWQQYQRTGGQADGFDWSNWGTPGGQATYRTVNPEDLGDIFGGGSGFSDFFSTLFGGAAQQGQAQQGGFSNFGEQGFQFQNQPQKGRDLEHNLQISLEEAFHGTQRTLQWEDGRSITAKIPRGVKTGSRIRLSGKGQPGTAGAPDGNLYLTIEVLPHAQYERDSDDLRLIIDVDLYTAVLGGKTNVTAFDKTVNLTIPAETQNSKTFRLRGLGMPNLRKPEKRGDLFATVNVTLPNNLSEKEKEIFEDLRDLR